MCGRYASARKRQELLERFQVQSQHADPELPPDYNVAPTKPVYAVLTRSSQRPDRPAGPGGSAGGSTDGLGGHAETRQLRVVRWGLVPSWAKDPAIGSKLINARAETVGEKPSFRRAFARRRCLLPADGYYEWQAGGQSPGTTASAAAVPGQPADPAPKARAGARAPRKVPYFIHPRDGGVLALAGLYELWRRRGDGSDAVAGPSGEAADDMWLWTVTIITTRAADQLGRIHDRMPMVIEPSRWADWLDPDRTDPGSVRELMVPAASGGLDAYPVSTAVNNVRNNGPGLIEPAPAEVISPGNGATSSPGSLRQIR